MDRLGDVKYRLSCIKHLTLLVILWYPISRGKFFERTKMDIDKDLDIDIPPAPTIPRSDRLQQEIDRLTAEYQAQQGRKWSYYEDLRKKRP
jgi:hypothetical protein